ncbi:MAG: protein jag [Jatrophihabitantaceae bacterium]
MSDTEVATESAAAESTAENTEASAEESSPDALLVQEGDIAADYLERLLDIVDFDGDIDLDVENDRAVVAIVGKGLGALIGSHGETLDALQELTRLAVAQKTGTRSRLMLDVSGHRQARRSELAALATDTAAGVKESGEPARLAPMNPFERKVVHDTISAIDGVRSESDGEEPNRRVVVHTED